MTLKELYGISLLFKFFFGRDNRLVTLKLDANGVDSIVAEKIHPVHSPIPSQKDILEFDRQRRAIRKRAARSTEKVNNYTIKRHSASHPPTKFKFGDAVLVRLRIRKGKLPSKRKNVKSGRIISIGKSDRYKVSYRPEHTLKHQIEWFSVSKQQKRVKSCTKYHRSKFCIPLLHKDRIEHFFSSGMKTVLDPQGDGNCLFSALAHSLVEMAYAVQTKPFAPTL